MRRADEERTAVRAENLRRRLHALAESGSEWDSGATVQAARSLAEDVLRFLDAHFPAPRGNA